MKRIYGMSIRRSDLAAWIEDHTFPTMCAIAQLYVFEGVTARNHWRHEVWEKFHQMKLLKSRNKLPSKKFILDSSWGVNSVFVKDAVAWAISREVDFVPRQQIDYEKLHNLMYVYFDWLSDKLSSSRVVSSKEVLRKLDELGLKV